MRNELFLKKCLKVNFDCKPPENVLCPLHFSYNVSGTEHRYSQSSTKLPFSAFNVTYQMLIFFLPDVSNSFLLYDLSGYSEVQAGKPKNISLFKSIKLLWAGWCKWCSWVSCYQKGYGYSWNQWSRAGISFLRFKIVLFVQLNSDILIFVFSGGNFQGCSSNSSSR